MGAFARYGAARYVALIRERHLDICTVKDFKSCLFAVSSFGFKLKDFLLYFSLSCHSKPANILID